MIHNSGIQRTLSLLNTDLGFIAAANGVAPTVGAVQLNSEFIRKAVTTSLIDGTTLVKEVFFDETQANGMIAAIGILGSGATAVDGTGQLFASGAASIVKDNTQTLTISFEIEVREVI